MDTFRKEVYSGGCYCTGSKLSEKIYSNTLKIKAEEWEICAR